MADENIRADEVVSHSRNGGARRWLLWLGALAVAFLLGLLPMWWSKRGVTAELEGANHHLKRCHLQTSLAAAAVYARRGEYETARQNASTFFTEMQAELDNANSTLLTAQEKTQVPTLMSARDDIITLLSRADPAAAERLSNVYVDYRSAMASGGR